MAAILSRGRWVKPLWSLRPSWYPHYPHGMCMRRRGLCDLEILRMTLKHNRAALLCHCKLCASFGSYLELQSGNAQFGSKSSIFRPVWPWNLTDDLEKIWHLFYTTSSFVHNSVTICSFKLELRSRNAHIGEKIVLPSVTLTSDLDLLNGHHFFSMVIILENLIIMRWHWEHSEKGMTGSRRDRWRDRWTNGRTWTLIELLGRS